MNYFEATEYLNDCSSLGSKPGLEAVSELLRRLGNPQDCVKVIHIAGTNGKGSIGSFLQSILLAAGYHTGFFTSPYFDSRCEMICYQGKTIEPEQFADIITRVKEQADAMVAEAHRHPTEFELMTAAAYLYFAEVGCDYAIIEAGMGGALDATNVMQKAEVSVLAHIDYDHQTFLGETLGEITQHKCGIFRASCPAVVYPCQAEEVLSMIQQEADRKGTPLFLPHVGSILIHQSDVQGSVFSYGKLKKLSISLCGMHQVYNAVTALGAISVLQEKGAGIPEDCIRQGLMGAKWSGRFEIVSENPTVILDGAHNADGAKAFTKTVQECFPGKRFIGVVAMLADKDYYTSLAEFAKVCDRLIVTKVPNPRTAQPEELCQVAEGIGVQAEAEPCPEDAVKQAFSARRGEQGILCVGSLYALPFFRKGFLKQFI